MASPPADSDLEQENDRLVRDAVRLKGMGKVGEVGEIPVRRRGDGKWRLRGDKQRREARWWQRAEVCTINTPSITKTTPNPNLNPNPLLTPP